MRDQPTPLADELELLTTAEVAELWRVSQTTIRRLVARGDLPAMRLGPHTVRLRARDLAGWLERGGR